MKALGLIETVGYSTAVFAADAGLKAADVQLRGIERVIGVGGSLGVSIEFEGEVAAVQSAIAAARDAGERVGQVVSILVIPRVHEEVSERILPLFAIDMRKEPQVADDAKTTPSQEETSNIGNDERGEKETTKRRTKHE